MVKNVSNDRHTTATELLKGLTNHRDCIEAKTPTCSYDEKRSRSPVSLQVGEVCRCLPRHSLDTVGVSARSE